MIRIQDSHTTATFSRLDSPRPLWTLRIAFGIRDGPGGGNIGNSYNDSNDVINIYFVAI